MAEQCQEGALFSVFWEFGLHLNLLRNHKEIERLQDIVDIKDQACPSILDELVGTDTSCGENISGDGENFAALFEC